MTSLAGWEAWCLQIALDPPVLFKANYLLETAHQPRHPSFSAMIANKLDADMFNRGSYLTATNIAERIGNVVYIIVGLIGIAVTTSCLTLRISSIHDANSFRQLSVIHVVMLAIYILGIAFCVSSLVLYYGYGTQDLYACHLAIITCLVFYLGQKIPLYIFLVERIHAVRSVTRTRLQDMVYLLGLGIVVLGFGNIIVVLFVWSIWEYNPDTKVCLIGFGFEVATVLLAFDIFINLWLTAVFLHYLRSYLTRGLVNTFVPRSVGAFMTQMHTENTSRTRDASIGISQPALVRMIRNSLLGSMGMCLTTIANIVVLIILKGHEQAWCCFTFCTVDVVWAVLITHWLTNTPKTLANCSSDLERSTFNSKPSSRVRRRSCRRDGSTLSSISMPQTTGQELSSPINYEQAVEYTQERKANHPPRTERSAIDVLVEEVFGSYGNKKAMNPSTADGRRTSPGAAARPVIESRESSRNTVVSFMLG